MKHARTLAVCLFGIVCSTHGLEAQDLSKYRNFELGTDLASVSTLSGVASSEAKTIHQRPAVLQALEYRPSRWIAGSTTDSTDPVDKILFSFYNDQLFRIVVDYGHDRTDGMTRADIIEAITAVYGPSVPKMLRAPVRVSQLESESGSPVARWGDSQHAVVLYETSLYATAFRLIVTEVRLEELARRADTQALRLDEQEAPHRENVRQQKERDDARTAAEKARLTNKRVFRP